MCPLALFFLCCAVKTDEAPLHNNVPSIGLAVKDQIVLKAQHAGFEYEVPCLLSSSKYTIGFVKELLEAQRSSGGAAGTPFTQLNLTWKGVVVSNETRVDNLLAELDPAWPEQQPKLIGHRNLTVIDLDLGEQLQCEMSALTDDMTLSTVLSQYQTMAKRMYLCAPLLARYTETLTSDTIAEHPDKLEQSATLWSSGLESHATLALKTQMFDIVLKEESEVLAARSTKKGIGAQALAAMGDEVQGTTIKVFDWWKIRQVKDAYSMAVTDSLSPSDQLMLDTAGGASSSSSGGAAAYQDELDDNDKLYKYQIRPECVLLVKREDFTAPSCLYICADCGNDVKLKARDAVRCRECFHRILFKKRIQKPCQYMCR